MSDHHQGGTTPADLEHAHDGEAPAGSAAHTEDAEQAERLRQELDDSRDRLLRMTAEFDNYRKRVDRERRESAEYAAMSLVEELLPILDDFERALAADAGPDAAAYREGVALIHRRLLDLLARRGVRPIDVEGEDFDPEWHQAVVYEPASGYRDGQIIEELRRGYRMGDRLLRPSMVKVAKA